VQVDPEVFSLIERSLKLSALTQGSFDITYGSMDKRFWNFDKTMTALPNPVVAKKMIKLINYRNVILDKAGETVFLKEKGMVIDFGGIGKGYAADRAKKTMRSYEKYVIIDGVKYSHTIDPRTGYPVRGIKSVTIICPSAEIADAMATPVMVMGIKAGLSLINQMKNIACLIIDDEDRLYTSNNINLHKK
jgi:Membrane-associated lipoprotein involved in thiamine biosynthesis